EPQPFVLICKLDGGGPHHLRLNGADPRRQVRLGPSPSRVRPPLASPSSRRQEMVSKMHAMLLSAFSMFKFRFDAPFTHISVGFIKSWVMASIPGLFVCMWCAAKKLCLANNVLGISSRFQVLFPTADAAVPSSMLSIVDTVISGICVALALCIAVPRGSKNPFFNCAFVRCTVSLAVIIIIMNWFQAAQGLGQPALQYVASGMIGFVAVHCVWNGEVKQGDSNQLMGKVWDWNMYGTKQKKFHGWVLHTDGDRGEDDATALPEDCGDGPKDGSSSGSDGHDGHEDGASDSGDSIDGCGARAVQLLAIRANYRISTIMAYDWREYRTIYKAREGEVQEEGMLNLVPTGPCRILEAYGCLGLEVFTADDVSCTDWWDLTEDEEVKEYTQTHNGGLGRKLEVTYVVIPDAIETHVKVKLNLKDLGSRSRAVYGSIKASAIDYGGKSVHLFSRRRGRSLSLPCGSTCILPLSPHVVALQYRRRFKIHIEVDLRVITTCNSQEEDKNLKFCLDFTRRITSQEREVDGDRVEVFTWYTDMY
ncbi:hypothetical protein EJB05_48679, partial [Eragrostis curvula]